MFKKRARVGRLVAGRETASGAAAMDGAEGGGRGGTRARLAWLAARRHARGRDLGERRGRASAATRP
ncbi:hypothetical protein, partial [Burkholderia pseudomallei]|uniref:hypothetical protein n=1 Tax=Burkholderia pseudomallei TaxID=28450 RepID=UPI001C4D5F8C